MSRVDLEALERLDKEAARAPWVHGGSLVRDCDSRIIGEFENYVGTAFVVHMRNALPAIIAELKAGRALAESVREWSRKKITRDYHPMEQCLDVYDAYAKVEG